MSIPSDLYTAQLEAIFRVERDRQTWAMVYFLDKVPTDHLSWLISDPDVIRLGRSEDVRVEIAERKPLLSVAENVTLPMLIAHAPLLAQLLGEITEPKQIVFARAAAFCNCDIDFLARIVEGVLAELQAGQGNFFHQLPSNSHNWPATWDLRPRNRECLTLMCTLHYSERPPKSFREMLHPHLPHAGRSITGEYLWIGKEPEPAEEF